MVDVPYQYVSGSKGCLMMILTDIDLTVFQKVHYDGMNG
jgi:hypothetical protein